MIPNFIKLTFRNLRKNRSYSFLNIFGLAIGIACAGLIFLWVEDQLRLTVSFQSVRAALTNPASSLRSE